MPTKAVQQFMLGTVLSNENEARQTLAAMKAAGYDGIELCGFMIHPIGFMVRLLTKAAGMPVGKGGNLDWHALVKEAGLQVVSLHTDLGSLERDAKAVADEAKSFGTKYVVITGMYRFDYGDEATMHDLAARLNKAGAALKAEGVELLYHNHNCELRHVNAEKRAYVLVMSHAKLAMYDTVEKVFGHAQELLELGLSVPQVTQIFLKLRQMGLDIPADVYTIPYAVKTIQKALAAKQGGGANA